MNRRVRACFLMLIACVALALVPAVSQAEDASTPEPVYQTLDELKGKKIAYVNGSVYNQFVHNKIGSTAKGDEFYASLADCVAAVEAGKAEAAVQLSYCCEAVVNRKGGTVALLPEHIADVEEAFFFPHGDPLIEEFNTVIKKFEEDGTIETLTKKWVSADESIKTLPEQDWDAPNGTLSFATSGVLDPYSYVGENGEIKGYDVELALLIAKELGYHLDVSTITMDAIFASVQSGKVDFGGSLTNTPERAETVDFTLKVMPSYVSAIVRSKGATSGSTDELEISSLSELPDKIIAAVTGSAYPKIVTDTVDGVTDKNFSYYDSASDCTAALKSNKVDVYVEGKAVCELISAKYPEVGMLDEPIAEDRIGMCLRKGSPLTNEINACLAKFKEDGTLDTLHDKWMSADEANKTMPEQDWEAPNGTLKVIGSVLEPMYYVGNNAEEMGYEAELILLIAKELGYHVTFSTANFSGLLGAIESGKADVAIGNISITEERKEKVDFTDPDYQGGIMILSRKVEKSAAASFIDDIASSFRKTFIEENRWQLILSGLGVTLLIAICSGVLGTLLGFGTVLARRKGVRWISTLVDGYQALMGGIPIVVVLMVLYYVVFGSISIAGEIVAILAFTLSFGSTSGTTMWTAIKAIDVGQEESGLALGYTRSQVFRKIIFPQAFQQFLPQLIGQSVSLLKETAVVGYIAVQDLTRASDLIRARTMDAFFPLISTAIIYFLCCRLIAWGLKKLTAHMLIVNRPRTIEGVVE